jgi:uncharacterized protein YjbI with pentapeptide repeats
MSLKHTSLKHTSLKHASLKHASLKHASLKHTSLKHPSLKHALLKHALLKHTLIEHFAQTPLVAIFGDKLMAYKCLLGTVLAYWWPFWLAAVLAGIVWHHSLRDIGTKTEFQS